MHCFCHLKHLSFFVLETLKTVPTSYLKYENMINCYQPQLESTAICNFYEHWFFQIDAIHITDLGKTPNLARVPTNEKKEQPTTEILAKIYGELIGKEI